jgi:hypothetical protein
LATIRLADGRVLKGGRLIREQLAPPPCHPQPLRLSDGDRADAIAASSVGDPLCIGTTRLLAGAHEGPAGSTGASDSARDPCLRLDMDVIALDCEAADHHLIPDKLVKLFPGS